MSATATTLQNAGPAPASPADPAGTPPKKSKKKLFAIVGVLVLLIGAYEAKSIFFKPVYKPGQTVPLGKILPLDQLTIAMSDGHMVQVSISLQLTSVANSSEVSADIPRFEDAAITVLGSETFSGLLPAAERAKVKQELLQRCQQIVGTVDGAAPQVSAVYFTGFVEQ